MTTFIEVKPGPEPIKNSQVAFWEQDANDHRFADPRWGPGGFDGAYIVGDPKNKRATYVIADTAAARQAIKDDRLVLVKENVKAAAGADKPDEEEPEAEPTDATGSEPDDEPEPPARTAASKTAKPK